MQQESVGPKYYGSKTIYADPKTLGEYNKFRGWNIPDSEDPNREGYLVQYEDGYLSWSPKEQFEAAYRRINNLTFGQAIEGMKQGKSVARSGWNGKGVFLYYVPENEYAAQTDIAKAAFPSGMVPYGAYIAMKTAQGNVVPWLASQTDVLSEDWVILN